MRSNKVEEGVDDRVLLGLEFLDNEDGMLGANETDNMETVENIEFDTFKLIVVFKNHVVNVPGMAFSSNLFPK